MTAPHKPSLAYRFRSWISALLRGKTGQPSNPLAPPSGYQSDDPDLDAELSTFLKHFPKCKKCRGLNPIAWRSPLCSDCELKAAPPAGKLQTCKVCGTQRTELSNPRRRVCFDCRNRCELCGSDEYLGLNAEGWCQSCSVKMATVKPELYTVCAKCSKSILRAEVSRIDMTMCEPCGKQCLRCDSYPLDKQLRLCRAHWEEHCLSHPETQTTCPDCSKTVPTSEIREGLCEMCRDKRDWKVCPKCNKLGAMKSKRSCWECWDGG